MAISQAMCSSYKEQLLGAVHDMDTDVFKIALYTSSATLGAATTIYSTSDQVVATGYTAGGNTLSGAAITLSGTTAFVDFSNTTWTTATITARGALIYNSSKSDKSVAVLDFGGDKSSTAGDFTVIMPTPDATNALIRIA
jgi:plastocyanin domain-containing protein